MGKGGEADEIDAGGNGGNAIACGPVIDRREPILPDWHLHCRAILHVKISRKSVLSSFFIGTPCLIFNFRLPLPITHSRAIEMHCQSPSHVFHRPGGITNLRREREREAEYTQLSDCKFNEKQLQTGPQGHFITNPLQLFPYR